jgi:hypothetical protein
MNSLCRVLLLAVACVLLLGAAGCVFSLGSPRHYHYYERHHEGCPRHPSMPDQD